MEVEMPGIIFMVYEMKEQNLDNMGRYNPLYSENNQGFGHYSVAFLEMIWVTKCNSGILEG